jgi:molybdate transport system permease protein
MCFLQKRRSFCKNGAFCHYNNKMRFRPSSTNRIINTNSQSDWLFVLPGLFLVALLGLPLLALLLRAFGQDFFTHALSDSALAALQLSMVTSTLSVVISLVAGTPLAYMLARWEFRGKTAIELLIDLPVVLPPSVAGLALLIAFGRQGLFGSWLALFGISLPFTTAAVVLAQTFVSAPLYVRAARIGFSEIDPQLEEAAHVEGATPWQMFREVMMPLAGPALVSGAILAWTRALGEFGATILFAGNLEGVTQTMPLAIYLGLERSLGVAIALSMVLIVVSLGLLVILRRLDKSKI